MTDKAYIVANKEQELDVLSKLDKEGFKWVDDNGRPQDWLPSKEIFYEFHRSFPYTITAYSEDNTIMGSSCSENDKVRIVFDGRKELKMDNMYKVTQEFVNELIKWRDDNSL